MWKRLYMGLLLVFFVSLFPISSLTEEEIKVLPTLSKTDLIKIIMLYENQLNETEQNLDERELGLRKRENSLMQSESLLKERETALLNSEAHLKIRESLLAESLQLQKQIRNNNLIYGGIGGITIGIIGTAIIQYNIK